MDSDAGVATCWKCKQRWQRCEMGKTGARALEASLHKVAFVLVGWKWQGHGHGGQDLVTAVSFKSEASWRLA